MLWKPPLISVVTAVHNGAPFLRELIESVLAQSYSHFEHIVIDDGSEDEGATVAILRQYPHLRWYSRENRGQYATQNEGILASKGDIITVISADDAYASSGVFAQVAEHFQRGAPCDVVYGRTLYMNEAGQLLPYQLDSTMAYAPRLVRYYPFVQHCALFVSSALVRDKQIMFDPSYRYAGDWHWIGRVFQQSRHTRFVRSFFAAIRIHALQTTQTTAASARFAEHRRVCASFGTLYWHYRTVRAVLQVRNWLLVGLTSIRRDGIVSFCGLFRNWVVRHFLPKSAS